MDQQALLTLLSKLIAIRSVTPKDHGCQSIIENHLTRLGFHCEQIPHPPVSNLWARIGTKAPLLVFAGHTDVVDVGDENTWNTPPFTATIKDGHVFGRGVCDMKGSLCAMVLAAKSFIEKTPNFNGSLGFLITSGEEGDQFDLGTPKVMSWLKERGEHIDYCVVGEPSSQERIGDVIKVGRRGSLTGSLKVHGKQGHVAYPHLALNPIHHITSTLTRLCETQYDNGNEFFPPTTFQVSNIHAGTGAGNIIPGALSLKFNFRYSTEINATTLKQQVETVLNEELDLEYQLNWRLNGEPFLTRSGELIKAATKAVLTHCNISPELSTGGGTSDGRFIAPYGVEVIELGPVNATIHQVNEELNLSELETLALCYLHICEQLLQ
jgi:succinyl-diaminopimelate desuccinylase